MKNILGLDLGTNSIGWSLVNTNQNGEGKIIGMGSRIIPMSQDIVGEFEGGNSKSQTAKRTRLRGMRRLNERQHLRRERLHRVLKIMGFLPEHYIKEIDFENHPGKFKKNAEPKLTYLRDSFGKPQFFYEESFNEMMNEFYEVHPQMKDGGIKVPKDWTIYYLRKKALRQKVSKYELAWIILNFNQKRGYYQLRGNEIETADEKKNVEYYSLKVTDVIATGENKVRGGIWYDVILENDWIYHRSSNVYLDWIGKTKDFIVTTELDDKGNVKTDKDGKEKRSFRAPGDDDWTLLKKKTENEIEKSGKTVGEFIYATILSSPLQKIRGKFVSTIERKFYKDELKLIIDAQFKFHPEFNDEILYRKCVEELYENNSNHRLNIISKNFRYLLVDDIIFYQRPLKSKKSFISNCPLESRYYKNKDGVIVRQPIKCIPKSNPLFQEFRLWQFLRNCLNLSKQCYI